MDESAWPIAGLARRLRELLPHLLVLGDYAPAERRGPACRLKCMLARTLEAADWPADAVPVVYLPGVSRADLRAIESCPLPLQPLAELQYRGVFRSQVNGRDWTPYAFLASRRGGLGLESPAIRRLAGRWGARWTCCWICRWRRSPASGWRQRISMRC
ncbi:MAG: hypothetical protein GVY09_15690 [Gammaproteobacteria bacterium]|nr:hypothetical protein [Gammaproteobacteria bacterium]